MPEGYLNQHVRCKACGAKFLAEEYAAHTDAESRTALSPPSGEPDLPTAKTQTPADILEGASADRCPYCSKVLDPPPKGSRKCPICREKIVMRRHKLLTESQASAFDLGVVEERAAREAAWKAEQERYACLPEGPISERQYREIIRRNAYIWASARYENGRLVLVSEKERDARLKHLRAYQTFWHRTSKTGKLIDPPEVEDVDLTTNLSYGVINLATGLVACWGGSGTGPILLS